MSFAGKERADYSAALSHGPLEAVIPVDLAGSRLDQALSRLFPAYSRTRLQAWIDSGRVSVDGATAAPKRKVWGGERVAVTPEASAEETCFAAEAIPLEILHEDAHLLVVNKPAGLVVHPGSGNWAGTMLNALLAHAPDLVHVPRAGIVHRLDKDTSGLLVVAKTLEAQTALVRQLQAHTVSRRYLAVVSGVTPEAGHVEAAVGRHPVHRTRMAVVAGGKPALTHYRALRRGAQWTLLECRLETGRTHQIRVHLDSIGHPLLGDPVYGARRLPAALAAQVGDFARQALHAWRLEIVHPETRASLAWEAPPPTDFQALLARLEAQ
ncbi:MAG: 23S rRNA pseudouridine(1911/1915/1917) synthase RluD [Betaproteobacteria bacterium]